MKTVLLVTSNPVHRKLYEPGLAKHFEVEYLPRIKGLQRRVDALVYDLGDTATTVDLRWLAEVDLPVVVLTSRSCDSMRVLKSKKRSFLTYPVRMDDILRVLAELGVRGEEEAEGEGSVSA